MAQASGKSGRYSYYKCTTRLNKNVAGCDSLNLPRGKADRRVLEALAEKVFTPARVALMLRELQWRQRAARTVENARVLKQRKELDRATACSSWWRRFALRAANSRSAAATAESRTRSAFWKERSWAKCPASYVTGAPGRI